MFVGCKRGGAHQAFPSHTSPNNVDEKKQNMKLQDQYFTTVRKHSFSPDREISTLEQVPGKYDPCFLPLVSYQTVW